jgi:LytS/YehU family sensor histidine kinase
MILIASDFFWRVSFDEFKGLRNLGKIFYSIFFIWAASTVFRIFNDQLKADRLNNERENIHLKTELAFLRTQISPHFIFNILNSLVALTRKYPDRVEPVVINLSDILRYMLYEGVEKKMTIEREINYLQSYIDLQKLRFGDSVNVVVDLVSNAHERDIEPMLLIPFIENAFKHGVGMITNPLIEIRLIVDDGELSFSVRNRYNGHDQKDNDSGIGLNNVTRRLKILYDNKHEISLIKDDEWFTAHLKIEF